MRTHYYIYDAVSSHRLSVFLDWKGYMDGFRRTTIYRVGCAMVNYTMSDCLPR